MAIRTNKVSNCNVYADGNNFIGRAEEVNLPEIGFTMSEHKGLGLIGVTEFPNGIDKLTGSIKWNAFYEDAFKKFANPFKAIKLMVRSSVQVWEGGDLVDEKPLVIFLTVQSKKWPLGNFKQNENVELSTDFSCTYVKVEFDNILQSEVDVQANIYSVGGTDLLAQYRTNLGI